MTDCHQTTGTGAIGSALRSGRRGSRFESGVPDHKYLCKYWQLRAHALLGAEFSALPISPKESVGQAGARSKISAHSHAFFPKHAFRVLHPQRKNSYHYKPSLKKNGEFANFWL